MNQEERMTQFYSIEGGEGVGKTTQLKMLRENLPMQFPEHTFHFTREPGGTPFADKIRELILSDDAKDADGKTMFGLFAAARAEHQRSIIGPMLAEGKTVVSDRYATATYAYQCYAQENPISHELFAAYYESLDFRPRLTIVLDMEPTLAQERVRARAGQAENHFDSRPLDFHERLRDGYREFAERFSRPNEEVLLVNANRSPEEVHQEIMAILYPRLRP